MRQFLLFVSISLSVFSASAQSAFIDSLENLLSRHPDEDSIRFSLLDNLAFACYEENPARGKAVSASQLTLAKKLHNKSMQASALSNLGINQWAQGNFADALASYGESKRLFEEMNQAEQAINIDSRIATVYFSSSEFTRALDLYFKNLSYYEKNKKERLQAICAGNIALCYSHLNKFENAIIYYRKAIAINTALHEMKFLADNYTNLGNMFDNMNKPDSAIYFYSTAMDISRKNNYSRNIASNLANMGIVYKDLKQFSNAYNYSKRALDFYRSSGSAHDIAVIQHTLASIFIEAPDSFFVNNALSQANKFAVAKAWLDSSMAFYVSEEDAAGQSEVWGTISQLYEKQNKFKEALNAYKMFKQFEDTVLNDENNEALARLEMHYSFSKREDSLRAEKEQIAIAASAEIKRESTLKKTILYGSSGVLISLLTIFFFYKRRRDAVESQQHAEYKSSVLETEMKALRAQMNPQFIFNSLNSIGDYISKNNIPQADRYLSKFSKLMRLILENSESREVSLLQDLEALELYIELELLRLNNKFSYQIHVEKNINKDETQIPPLLLQPFVENSIWHGIATLNRPGHIKINIGKKGDLLICVISDNGNGRDFRNTKDTSKENKSLGVKITRERIEMLNRQYGSNGRIEFRDLEPGLLVEVTLPLINNAI